MPRDDSACLMDMLVAARDAVSSAEGVSFEDFVLNKWTHLSVLKSLEIVGEAVAHVSKARKRAIPLVPWKELVGMRNRLVHANFDIDLEMVGDSVHHHLQVRSEVR